MQDSDPEFIPHFSVFLHKVYKQVNLSWRWVNSDEAPNSPYMLGISALNCKIR